MSMCCTQHYGEIRFYPFQKSIECMVNTIDCGLHYSLYDKIILIIERRPSLKQTITTFVYNS